MSLDWNFLFASQTSHLPSKKLVSQSITQKKTNLLLLFNTVDLFSGSWWEDKKIMTLTTPYNIMHLRGVTVFCSVKHTDYSIFCVLFVFLVLLMEPFVNFNKQWYISHCLETICSMKDDTSVQITVIKYNDAFLFLCSMHIYHFISISWLLISNQPDMTSRIWASLVFSMW